MSFSCLLLHVVFFKFYFQIFFMLHSHLSATPPSHLTHLSVCCVLQPSSPVRPRRMWELRHLGGAGGEMSNVASQKGLETNLAICLEWIPEKNRPNYAQRRHLNEEAELKTCLQIRHDRLQLRATWAMENRRKLKSKQIICVLLLGFKSWAKYSVK